MRRCRLCTEAGYEIVPGAVFSGTAVSRVMLIGQAPGVTEVEAKRPFNAGSGRRLFQWLGEAGWDEDAFRRRHYMTAVTKCYPGKGSNGKGDRVPSKAEQQLCRPFLEQELALVKPRLIILVGGLAIKLMFPRSARLKELVGTAVYLPPSALSASGNFSLQGGQRFKMADELLVAAAAAPGGRAILPLPHPSGASLWPNKPANKELIARAVMLLDALRTAWQL